MTYKDLGSHNNNPFYADALTVGKENTGQFNIIQDALDQAASGQIVIVGPGTYSESFTIPSGVVVKSAFGPQITTIDGSAATGTRVTLSDSGRLEGFTVDLPTDALPSIAYAGSISGVASNIILTGNGASGIGIRNSGSGTLVITDIAYTSGACDAVVENTGVGQIASTRIGISGGTVTDGLRATSGTMTSKDFTSTASGVVDAITVGAATVQATNPIIRDATNFIHVTSNSTSFSMSGGVFNNTGTNHLLIDSGISTATVLIGSSAMSQSKINVPGAWSANNSHSLNFTEIATDDISLNVWSGIHTGHAERGSRGSIGEGDSYTRGLTVFTTDSTASSTTDGAGFIDVSSLAASSSGSTFSFQGPLANFTILIGTTLTDASTVIKHFGLEISQTIAASEIIPKSFAFEIWTGTSWTEINVMATHSTLFHRYGNETFLRTSTIEHIRYGITGSTTWSTKLINGVTAYWARIRITTTVNVPPTFEQFKLFPSNFEINEDGTNAYHGRSRFRQTILGFGNVFGETGGVIDDNQAVGSGGVPTGWTHNNKNSLLNQNGDAIYTQISLPKGIDTGHPVKIKALYGVNSASSGTLTVIVSALPIETEGNLIADPAGGTTPLARTLANTETLTAKVAQTDTQAISIAASSNNKILSQDFGDFDVSDHYEGDTLLIRLEMEDDGIPNYDLSIWALEISGVKWTHGERQ